MAKAVFVSFCIALSIVSSFGYQPECAVGPEHWCKSFQTAQDCGALRHCTDTVWRYDEGSNKIGSSTNCEWCQKILENTHQGIQHLANNEDLIRSSLVKGCELFPFENVASKCSNALKEYGPSVGSLMKHKRYATLCHLMDICSVEQPTTTEKPPMLGSRRCTWGPSYWCSSLSNSRECSSMDHCSNRVWSQQSIQKKSEDSVCQYCQFTMTKLRNIIGENRTEIEINRWLTGACSMLPSKPAIDECVKLMDEYTKEIVILIQSNIDPSMICHLVHMCKDATIVTRVEAVDPSSTTEKSVVTVNHDQTILVDEQSKMLCNVIVRATHELHVSQKKNRMEIRDFLENDCQKLSTAELVEKCTRIVDKHGADIYGHVASHVELSKICDYMDNFADHSAVQSLPNVHCELCTFVLTTTKYMLDAKQAEEKILGYIDEQICSRLTGSAKTTCQHIIETNGRELLDDIKCGTKSMLLCTRFQICIDQVLSPISSISKTDKTEYLKENICDQLGSMKDACYALIEQDGTRVMKTLFNDMEGDVLCRMFGICPKKMSLMDNLSIKDDTNKCKRCIDDFTRRKHIAEKLVNRSSEFLHHLCGQLPDKDACTKAVDDSINELVNFVRSLDPQDICEQLKYCNQTLLQQIQPIELTSSENVMSEEIIAYIKSEICSKLGALAEMCTRTIDAEGPAILKMISKDIDPKKACTTLGVCTGSSSFENCNDKCECCMDKIEIHEVQIATFLRTMVESIRTLCQHMPDNAQCVQMTTKFDANINQITSHFNSKKVCQMLNHCSNMPIEIETLSQCQTRIESKRLFLVSAISTINQNLKSLCDYIPWNKDCHAIIDRSTLDTNDKLSGLNVENICTSGQSLMDAVCIKNTPFESLCKQLVTSDENNLRMEAIFKSMFNQNGNVEKELCELQSTECSSSSITVNNCKDKCDCCVQFYTTKKDYDLKIIEAYRTGLLATCDWSLSKDNCIAWFNRVCDRLKTKVDEFIPTTYCKRMGLCSIADDACSFHGDKCQCCKNHFNTRGNRFRTIVSEVTNTLTSFCTNNECRSTVQSAQQQTLAQIDRVDSQIYCQRYGYCAPQSTFYMSRVLATHIGSDIEGINDRLEAAITSDICFQHGQMRPMCEHLMASKEAHRYGYMYLAFLKNNPKLFDDDLREQMQTKTNADVCTSCKNAVQSAKDSWMNSLSTVRDVLIRTCERCPVKDQCRDYYNQRFDQIKSYIDSIDANQFCQSIHLCSTRSIIVVESTICSTCVERLQAKKEGVLQAVNRLAVYFDELCQRFANKQCQVFIEQIKTSVENSIGNVDPKQVCTSIGFCSTTNEETQMNFDAYEKQMEDEIEKNICSTLGPFQSLCKQVIRGNRKQIQTVKINYNIKDLMQIGMKNNLFTAATLNECDQDKCQCCIDRVNEKKTCVKNIGDQVLSTLSSTCDYCPSKDQCRQFWKGYQTQFDSCIDDIDAKQVCTRIGFCNASKLCENMGVFQQACEETLTAFMQGSKTIEEHLPHTSVVILPTQPEIVQTHEITMDSNSTCILCEYMMKILSNYIHQQSTEQEIEQSLEKVCNDMPSTLRNQCHDLVENYGPSIISVLIGQFDPLSICQKLNLCTKQMKVNLSHLTKASVVSCGVCDYVSTYIEFALKRDSSEKSLQHALATVCTHLSSEQVPQCQTLIQLFSPRIRQLDLQLGKNFCRQLGICEADKEKPSVVDVPLTQVDEIKNDDILKERIIENLDDTPQCMLCHYVVTYLDAVLKTNKSQAAIEAALEKVCTILPTKERAQCDQFVKTYGPVLAELLSEMADPDTVCRYLGACQVVLPKETSTTSTQPVTYPNHDYVTMSKEEPSYKCTICTFIISRMKHYAAENQTAEEILASLRKSCDLFAVISLKEQCESFLDQYGPYIIQMVSSDVQPKVACQDLGLCDKSSQTSTSVPYRQSTPRAPASSTNYGKCIYGMSYWCTSRQNAQLCNAVELCERQVWSKKNKNIVI